MGNKRTDVDVIVVLDKHVLSNVNTTESFASAQLSMVENNLYHGLKSYSILIDDDDA